MAFIQKVGADEATALQGGRAINALLAVADGNTARYAKKAQIALRQGDEATDEALVEATARQEEAGLPATRIAAVADGETEKMVCRARQTDHRQRMCRLLDSSSVLQNENSLIHSDCAFPG
jgi:hypothetical protein